MSESLPPTIEPTAEACDCCAEPEAEEHEARDREALPLPAACRLDPEGQRQQRDHYRPSASTSTGSNGSQSS
jgi:hypothetical protein